MAKLENINLVEGLDFGAPVEAPAGNSIINIPIRQIKDYHNHTFYVLDDDSMSELTASIQKFGLLEPLMVRKVGEDEYELISGHRRKMACEKAGISSVPVVIKELENDDADIMMVDSNLYREHISLTEKVKSCRVKYEALKNKTGKPIEELAKDASLSATQAYRYIRLSYLNDFLLKKIEDKKFTIVAGVILSQLTVKAQETLGLILIAEDKIKISEEQAEKLVEIEKFGALSVDAARNVLLSIDEKGENINYKKVVKAFRWPDNYDDSPENKVLLIQKLLNEFFEKEQ